MRSKILESLLGVAATSVTLGASYVAVKAVEPPQNIFSAGEDALAHATGRLYLLSSSPKPSVQPLQETVSNSVATTFTPRPGN